MTTPKPSFLDGYWQNSFNFKQHLQAFLKLDSETIEKRLKSAQLEMTQLGNIEFNWEKADNFYSDKVQELYLFELGEWHLISQDYIGGTLLLIERHSRGRVLDFGGGIGTHTIAAALCPQVEQVIYYDINPVNRNFVQYRVDQLGLGKKIICSPEAPLEETFDTIFAFDVLEHIPDPSKQLLQFHKSLKPEGKIILNWNFFKGFNEEIPFHLDDPKVLNTFFQTLQTHFLEIFQPYHISARCYRKWGDV